MQAGPKPKRSKGGPDEAIEGGGGERKDGIRFGGAFTLDLSQKGKWRKVENDGSDGTRKGKGHRGQRGGANNGRRW